MIYIYIIYNVLHMVYFIRYHLRVYENVFTGTELVDWLLTKQLVNSREDAVNYGDILLQGQIIEHAFQEHNFHDENYFYQIKRSL